MLFRCASRPTPLVVCLLLAGFLCAQQPAQAWSPKSQRAIAGDAARLVPPDLYRQLVRNRGSYLEGVNAAFSDRNGNHHVKNEDGSGQLDVVITRMADNAIAAIQAHQPFSDISYRLGLLAYYVANASNPLNSSQRDRQERRYGSDYLRYMQSAQGRFQVVFYGFRPYLRGRQALPRLVQEALNRSRSYYPLVGREYRRVDFRSGLASFDDRSTAYGIAALSYSHAVSDVAEALRLVWLEAGGADLRPRLPQRGQGIVRLPRGRAAR